MRDAHNVILGVDSAQESARRAAGFEASARPSGPRAEKGTTSGIAVVECSSCGCTAAYPTDGKRHRCSFCDAMLWPVWPVSSFLRP